MANLLSQTNKDVLVVYFTEANLVSAPQVEAAGEGLMELMKRAEHGKLLLNFQVVRAMSSSMLGKLIKLHKECAGSKIDLKLSNVCDSIMEVFSVTKLNKVFDIHDDEGKALKAFGRAGWFFRR